MRNGHETELERLRGLFGATTTAWAEHLFDTRPHAWTALSGGEQPDYNLALIHGGEVRAHIERALVDIERSRRPAIVMLAGPGLAGAQALTDAGWVCVGAMPFMVRENSGGTLDSDVRELTTDDLVDARALAGAAFGVGAEVAGRVFTPRILAHPDTTLAGLFIDEKLVSCGLMCRATGASTGWALATAAEHRGSGYARRLVAGNLEIDFAYRGPTVSLCLATPSGCRMYEKMGFTVVEYWQTWSKPRWFLGGS